MDSSQPIFTLAGGKVIGGGGLPAYFADQTKVKSHAVQGGKIGHTMQTEQAGELMRVVFGREMGQNCALSR